MKQPDDDHCHIVAPHAPCLAAGCQAVVHDIFTNLLQLLFGCYPSSNEFNHRLRRLAIPDTFYTQTNNHVSVSSRKAFGDKFGKLTIACDHQKLIVFGDLVSCNIRRSSHNLLLGRQRRAFLKFKVAERTRQGQVAVNSAKVNKATRRTYPSFFTCLKRSENENNTAKQSTTDLHSEVYGQTTRA